MANVHRWEFWVVVGQSAICILFPAVYRAGYLRVSRLFGPSLHPLNPWISNRALRLFGALGLLWVPVLWKYR